ncbi:MAG: hypothetical protein ACRYFX_13980 [Janthinobacterium lividum]
MGSFSNTLKRRLVGHPPRPEQAAALPADELQLALPDGRKLWAYRVPRAGWGQLPAGTQLLLIRACRQHLPWVRAVEMAQVEQNRLDGPGPPCLVLAWGWLPEGQPDTRPGTILLPRELATVLRYEIRETGCPDVVATINPLPN